MIPGPLFLLVSSWLLAAPAYEQTQGPAVLRLDAPQEKDGRVAVPLGGTLVKVRISGKAPVEATWVKTSSPAWKIRQLSGPPADKLAVFLEQRFWVEPLGKPGETLDLTWSVRYRLGDQPERALIWKIPVRIVTEIQDARLSEMRPGTPPEQVPPARSWRETAAWAEAALLLGALLLVLGELIRRRFRRRKVLSPVAWADRELERLAGRDWASPGEGERFPALLADVVRRYLELRFRLPASRQTTAEFLAASRDAPPLTPGQKTLLGDLLHRGDLAKFARVSLFEEECRTLLARARGFVQETTADIK